MNMNAPDTHISKQKLYEISILVTRCDGKSAFYAQ